MWNRIISKLIGHLILIKYKNSKMNVKMFNQNIKMAVIQTIKASAIIKKKIQHLKYLDTCHLQ
jgi:hypothetical protein